MGFLNKQNFFSIYIKKFFKEAQYYWILFVFNNKTKDSYVEQSKNDK